MRYLVRIFQIGAQSVQEQLVEAPSEEIARASIQSQGLAILSVRESARDKIQRVNWRGFKQKQQIPLFCRELRTLIKAGMTVVEAVDTLCARETALGQTESISRLLLEKLNEGQSLSNALSCLVDAPPVVIAAVRAGERTSNLIESLDDYLRYHLLVEHLRRKVINAAIYPALVTALGLAVTLFLLIIVLPNFSKMYQSFRGRAKGLTALVIDLSNTVNAHQTLTLLVVVTTFGLCTWWILSGRARKFLLIVSRKVPWINLRIQDFELAMIYQTISLLLKGGYPMMEAVGVAKQAALTPALKIALDSVHRHIETGGSVSQAFAGAGLCDEVGRRLMAAGERTGNFYLAADVVSQLHSERFELFVERLTRVIEPLLLLGVALAVGTIVVAMYLPVFDMTTGL